jgi:DNA polymerase-3 subunit delta'
VLRTVITVDETRETISFFGSTAAVAGWRICIVDTVDELNQNAANALLKIRGAAAAIAVPAGEPRAGAGAADYPVPLSPRCRCGRWRLTMVRAAAVASGMDAEDPALIEAAEASESRRVARADAALGGDALVRARTATLLATLPQVDPRELPCALGRSSAIATAWRLRPLSTVSNAGSASVCTDPSANANLPRPHGWRRYGKDRPRGARIPQTTISSESPLFSRFFAARGSDTLARQ